MHARLDSAKTFSAKTATVDEGNELIKLKIDSSTQRYYHYQIY